MIAVEQASEIEHRRVSEHPNDKEDWLTNIMIDQNYQAAYLGVQQLGLHRDWATYDDYWRGHQNPPEHDDDPGSVTNLIQPIIESQVADLVDSPVDFLAIGREPSDQAHAAYVRFILKWIWDQNKMDKIRDQFERIRLKYGTAIWKVYFDPLGNKGKGKVVIDIVGPEKFYPDAKITNPHKIQDADYICQVSDVSLSYLRRRFGERAKYVRPRVRTKYDANIYQGETVKEALGILNNSTTLIEHWSRDDQGKLRLVYKADDVILWDSKWDPAKKKKHFKGSKYFHAPGESFYKHGKYPFVVVPCYLREGQLWGMGDVELLKPIQDLVNDFDDQIRMNTRLMGNIQIVVGLASGINPSKWTNKVGLRVPARDPNAWRIVQPQGLPPHVMDRREIAKREAETISGRPDVVEGRKPAGLKAASAIIALQEAGNRRVNHKRLMTESGLAEVLDLAFEHFREHFTHEMAIRIAGKEVEGNDAFIWVRGSMFQSIPKLVPDRLATPDERGVFPLKPLRKKGEDGQELEEYETKEAEFDFHVSVGSGLPRNKAFLYQAAVELHREQILTTEEVRQFMKEMIDWPLMTPYEIRGVFSQMRREQQPQQSPPMEMTQTLAPPPVQPPTTGTPNGMDPSLVQVLSQMLGGR